MSPRTRMTREATSSPAIMRRRHGSSPRPKATGRSPSASRPRMTHEPMQPNAPVTRVVMAPARYHRPPASSVTAAVPATRLPEAVVHAPGSSSQAVAEHALMMMLVCVKHAVFQDKLTRAGDWGAKKGSASTAHTELHGKTLGIVGIGNIGRRIAGFCGAIGMKVLAYDKYVPADEIRRRGAQPVDSLEALMPQVDVLTCHTPLTPETRHMINAKTLGLMRRGAVYVNTSRGGVQDEHALFEALTRGQLGAAGIDVFEEEPCPVDNPLLNLDNVVLSTHMAGVTKEATARASVQVTSEMLRVLRGEKPDVLVNPEVGPRLGLR